MNAQHTPGPWIWGDNFNGLYGAGPNNEVLNYASYEGMWLGYHKAQHANARLIAAAPDLLEALKACIPHLERDDHHTDALSRERPHYAAARAAIAKATGEKL